MNNYIIIVAGGKGTRMGTSIPKQFLMLGGKAVLHHTVQKFNEVLPNFKLLVVLPENDINFWKDYCKTQSLTIDHEVVVGGKERFYSVQNALHKIKNGGCIGIHDGVRPLVSTQTILRAKEAAIKLGNAIPVVPVKESLRETMQNGKSVAKNRESFKLVQTPQFFNFDLLNKAYQQKHHANFTDDASVVENLGTVINLVEGNLENIKLTNPLDLMLAEILIAKNHSI